jgi:hypothetical protein
VLVSGLNLIVGSPGNWPSAIALLTLGAYTTSMLVAGTIGAPVPVFLALLAAGLSAQSSA